MSCPFLFLFFFFSFSTLAQGSVDPTSTEAGSRKCAQAQPKRKRNSQTKTGLSMVWTVRGALNLRFTRVNARDVKSWASRRVHVDHVRDSRDFT
jgi:hypothetical protein